MVLRLVAGAFLFVLVALPAAAHPHVWVEVKAEVSISAGYVEGVWTSWSFDDAFSQLILADFPAGPDGKITDAASAAIKKGYFDNLKDYQFFSHVDLGGKKLKIPVPEKFRAQLGPKGEVVYRFYLPLNLRLDAKTGLAVSFYDDSFFTDMVFVKTNPVALTVTDGGKASVVLKPDKSKTFYGGQVTPTFAFIAWSPQ